MSQESPTSQLEGLTKQINVLREKMTAIRRAQPPQPVKDYELRTATGEPVMLSQLFGDKTELMVVHNMGRRCSYCTLWADGFNGVINHLENRAAFVVSSPDAPDVQAAFAASRGWRFRMVSTAGTTFAGDLGYEEGGGTKPGVSVFLKRPEGLVRVSHDDFGPGDDYCHVWHLFGLLPGGSGEWQPKFAYRD